MSDKLVFDFDERCDGGRELLGGKGLGLAEMTALGLPVPAGFTITTEACREHLAHGGELPDALRAEIDDHLAALERRTGKRFGDPAYHSIRLSRSRQSDTLGSPIRCSRDFRGPR